MRKGLDVKHATVYDGLILTSSGIIEIKDIKNKSKE